MNIDLADRELMLTRVIDAPRRNLFRAWTEPKLIVQWFTPPPFKTIDAQVDLRPGGRFFTLMQSPEGEQMPNDGVFLEVVPDEKLVFTDTYTAGWIPNPSPFMTAILTFEDAGPGRTRYTARARHRSPEDRASHEQMGFHEGWGAATDQLAALAAAL